MYFKSQLDSNLEDGLGRFDSETALIPQSPDDISVSFATPIMAFADDSYVFEVSAPSEGSAYILDITRSSPLSEISATIEPPELLMMQSSSPLGEFSGFLGEAQSNVLIVRGKVEQARETAEIIRDALDTFEKIEKAADGVEKTLEGLANAMKLVAKVPALKVIANGLRDVFKDLAVEVRKLEKEAKDIDDKIEDNGWKTKADDTILTLEGVEDRLTLLSDEIGDARDTVDTADAVYSLIVAHSSDIEMGIQNALLSPSTLYAAYDIDLTSFDGLVGDVSASFGGITGLLNLARGVEAQISGISNSIGFLRAPMEILTKALKPIEWALDAIDFIFDKVVAPILNPILEALGVTALFNKIKAQLLGLFPDFNIIGDLETPLTDIFADLDLGLVSGLTGNLDGLEIDLDAILNDAFGIGTGDEAIFIQIDETNGGTEPIGGDGNDLISGNTLDNALVGGPGDDVLTPGAGDDSVDGGDGTNDAVVFSGKLSEYRIIRIDANTIQIIHAQPEAGAQDDGTNTIINTEVFIFNDVELTLTDLNNFYDLSTDSYTPSAGRDFVIGSAADEIIDGGDGNDFLQGGGGNDVLRGEAGDDVLSADSGADTLIGGTGFDTVTFAGQSAAVRVSLFRTDPTDMSFPNLVPPGTLTHYVDSVEQVIGSDFDDYIFGDATDNVFLGGSGRDRLRGLEGDDQINGGDDQDYIFGDQGDDILNGGDGYDYIAPGAGDNIIDVGAGGGTVYYGAAEVWSSLSDVLIEINFFADPATNGLPHHIIFSSDTGIVERYDVNNVLLGTDTVLNGDGYRGHVWGTDNTDTFYGAMTAGQATTHFGGGGDDIFYLPGLYTETFTGGTGDDSFIYTQTEDVFQDATLIILGEEGYDSVDFSASAYGIDTRVGGANFTGSLGFRAIIGVYDVEEWVLTDFDDFIIQESGVTYYAGGGNDIIVNRNDGASMTTIWGGTGNDIIVASGDLGIMAYGEDGDDTFFGNGLNFDELIINTYIGDIGNDIFHGSNAREVFNGGDGIDLVDYSVLVFAGSGNRPVTYANGLPVLNQNFDPVFIDIGAGFFFDSSLSSDSPLSHLDTYISIENINAGYGDDYVYASDVANVVRGLDGGDRLVGLLGDDTIFGNEGDDYIYGDYDPLDEFGITGSGGGGDDVLNGGLGNNILHGGVGNDTADFGFDGSLYGQVVVDLTLAPTQDRGLVYQDQTSTIISRNELISIENINGGDLDDTIAADDIANVLRAGGGDDFVLGRAGDDVLFGGDGDDLINGGINNDILIGGRGNDQIYGSLGVDISDYSFNTGATIIDMVMGTVDETYEFEVPVWADTGTSEARFSAANNEMITPLMVFESDPINANSPGDTDFAFEDDFLEDVDGDPLTPDVDFSLAFITQSETANDTFSGIENIEAGFGDDIIIGNNSDNQISGNAGNDMIEGGNGNDTLLGGDGDDILIGDGGSAVNFGFANVNIGGQDRFADGSYSGSVTDHLEVETADSFGGAAFTFEALYQASEENEGTTLFLSYAIPGGGGGPDNEFIIHTFPSGEMHLRINGALYGTNIDTTFLNDGALHRVSVSYEVFGLSGAQFKFYVDGIMLYESPLIAEGAIDTGGNLIIGQEQDNLGGGFQASQIYSGQVGDIRIWDSVRSEAEIAANAFSLADASNPDLLENWVFDEGTIQNRAGTDIMTLTGGSISPAGVSGDDILDGGEGVDRAVYISSLENYRITEQADGTVTVMALSGNEGTDTLTSVEELEFDGVVYLTADIAAIGLTEGNDNYTATDQADIIYGLAGNDFINGLAGDDTLFGEAGSDTLIGGAGADVLDGGAGLDAADYRTANSRVAFDVVAGGTLGDAAGDSYISIERFYGSNFNDTITGSSANEFFYGEDGNDVINGGGGIDRIYGGAGNDVQRGQDGNDTLYGSAGADQLNGGVGTDVANYRLATAAIALNLATGGTLGDAAGDTYFGIEAVYGSDFNDAMTGSSGTNDLRGFDGDDTLDGAGGNDRLYGGEGADLLNGGAGIDTAHYATAAAAVTLDLTTGGTGGEAAGDSYSSIEWVVGSSFDDDITGDNLANRLSGGDGADTLNGAGGNDRLLGGDGNDIINGGDGIDTIFGQDGDDVMTGGAGNDFFFGGAGADSHDGGDGIDTVSYLASTEGVNLWLDSTTLGTFDAAGDIFVSIERVFGSNHNDLIFGAAASSESLFGLGGDDILWGGAGLGSDSLFGGAGDDLFYYGANEGADVIFDFQAGSASGDVIDFYNGDAANYSFSQIMALASQVGNNVIFDFGSGNTLTLVGVDITDLTIDDFAGVNSAEPLENFGTYAGESLDIEVTSLMFEADVLI
ncbi:MAG: LamG-like jellyroll fold domain-containing protein [Hellea sp.]